MIFTENQPFGWNVKKTLVFSHFVGMIHYGTEDLMMNIRHIKLMVEKWVPGVGDIISWQPMHQSQKYFAW